MVLILYGDLLSQPSRAVYQFMKAAGVNFEFKQVDLGKNEQLKPEYVKKTPIGKIPIIEDDGFILTESVAIMRYVAAKYKLAEHWYPRADVKKQSRVDEFLNWQHTQLRQPCISVFLCLLRSRVTLGPFTQQPLDPEKLKSSVEGSQRAVTLIADYFLKDKPYIAGDDISAADLIGVNELMQLYSVEREDIYESNPKVKAWIKRVEERIKPHFNESLEKVRFVRGVYKDAKK